MSLVHPSLSQESEEDIDWGPTPAPTPGKPNWEVEIFNIDDKMALNCNGNNLRVLGFGQRERINIDHCLSSGNNRISIIVNNQIGGYTYGLRVYRAGQIAISNTGRRAELVCGQAGVRGCNNDSQSTGIVFRKNYRIEKP